MFGLIFSWLQTKGKLIWSLEENIQIYDPELPVNIYELGLIYDVTVENENFAKIKMTLTTRFPILFKRRF